MHTQGEHEHSSYCYLGISNGAWDVHMLSYYNQLFTVHHLGYYNLVSLIFGTTIPTSFNILMKCFLHLFHLDLHNFELSNQIAER